MKKTLIISSLVLAAGLTAGVILNQPQEAPITSQALTFDGYVEPMTAPEAVEAPEVIEAPIVTNQTEEAPTEPLNEAVEPIVYSLDMGRDYFTKTYPGVDVYYYDQYFEQRPWQLDVLNEHGEAFLDHVYNTVLRLRDNQSSNLGGN